MQPNGYRKQVSSQHSGRAIPAPRFYSVAEVAALFGISPMTLYRAINDGQFPAVRIRGRLIVPAQAVEAMAEAAVAEQGIVDAAGWALGEVAN
jgi:excisionase family DNA binding protein